MKKIYSLAVLCLLHSTAYAQTNPAPANDLR